jgi:CRP-like cAMP-binding protein
MPCCRPHCAGGGAINALIASLSARDRRTVLKSCEEVDLALGDVLCAPGAPIRHIYFPVTSYISLITPKDVVDSLEVGLIGREGVFGITVLLEVNDSPLLALVQGAGAALRLTTPAFRKAVAESAPFRRMLNRYLYVLMAQLAQSAACGRFHLLDARLARWLLMTHDRAGSKTFNLTHQFLAFMLGVRRSGVSVAAERLQGRNLIRYNRGRVEILDRKGLEALSCPCYASQLKIYRQRMGIRNGRASKAAAATAVPLAALVR